MIMETPAHKGFVNRRSRVRATHPAPQHTETICFFTWTEASRIKQSGTNGAQRPTEFTQKGPHRNLPVPVLFESEKARFWALVERGPVDKCWPWKGAANAKGYGRFKLGGKLYSPHRVAFCIAYGTISDGDEYHGSVVMHDCDNPRCCNPVHLVLGNQRQNVEDMDGKRRGNRSKPNRVIPTQQQINEILASPQSAYALSEKLGFHHDHINRIRRQNGVDTLAYKYRRVS